MADKYRKLLLMQGFCSRDIDNNPTIGRLARWTPLSCATFGAAGVSLGFFPFLSIICPCTLSVLTGFWIKSGWFFIILGLLTLTGGMTDRSIYDRFYNLILRHIFRTSAIPKQGAPRRFGCTIGGTMFLLSGIGFLKNIEWLAFGPAIFMIVFATIAGLSQWCFASNLYALLFKKDLSSDENNLQNSDSKQKI
jgi:hypothetical protein